MFARWGRELTGNWGFGGLGFLPLRGTRNSRDALRQWVRQFSPGRSLLVGSRARGEKEATDKIADESKAGLVWSGLERTVRVKRKAEAY